MSAQANGTWEGKFGTMYKFEIVFDNGDVGEYSSKNQEQNKFVVGQNADYEYTGGQYPKVKPVWNQGGGFSGGGKSFGGNDDARQRMIVKQSSLKVAVEFQVAKNPTSFQLSDVFSTADKIVAWVMNEEQKKAEPVKSKSVADIEDFANKSGASAYPRQEEENLPF